MKKSEDCIPFLESESEVDDEVEYVDCRNLFEALLLLPLLLLLLLLLLLKFLFLIIPFPLSSVQFSIPIFAAIFILSKVDSF